MLEHRPQQVIGENKVIEPCKQRIECGLAARPLVQRRGRGVGVAAADGIGDGVVRHLFDVVDVWADVGEKLSEASIGAKSAHVPGEVVPADAQYVAVGVFVAAGQFVVDAVLRHGEQPGGGLVCGLELLGPGSLDSVTDVLGDHDSTSSHRLYICLVRTFW